MVREMSVSLLPRRGRGDPFLLDRHHSRLGVSNQDALDAIDPSRLRPQLLPAHLRRCRVSRRPDPLRQTRQGPRRSLPLLLPVRIHKTCTRARSSPTLTHTDRPAASNASSARSMHKHPACSTTSGSPTASSSPAPCSSSWPAPSPFCFATALLPHAKHQWRREPETSQFDLIPILSWGYLSCQDEVRV